MQSCGSFFFHWSQVPVIVRSFALCFLWPRSARRGRFGIAGKEGGRGPRNQLIANNEADTRMMVLKTSFLKWVLDVGISTEPRARCDKVFHNSPVHYGLSYD